MIDPRSAGPLGRVDVPQSSQPKVEAGGQVMRGKFGAGPGGRGTASLVVRSKVASTGALVLTCAHVLGVQAVGDAAAIADANTVYSPEYSESCGIACNKPFGQVVNATLPAPRVGAPGAQEDIQAQWTVGQETFAVDAALIDLTPAARASNVVEKIGAIAGTRDLVAEWSLGEAPLADLDLPPARRLAVRKYGATTQYTEGTVRRLARQHVVMDVGGVATPFESLVLEIEANPGQTPFSRVYELDMERCRAALVVDTREQVRDLFNGTKVTATLGGTPASPTLKVTGTLFSLPGDSGAPIVDAANRVVGIVRSGSIQEIYVRGQADPAVIGTGNSQGVFIVPALDLLGVAFLPAGQGTAGAPVVVPGMAVARGPREGFDLAALDRLARRAEETLAGARLADLARRHFGEARELVHRRRRVTVAWHRYKGPAFVAAFLRAAPRPGEPLPREIDGVPLAEALRVMRDVLVAEGSDGLRAAILDHEAELLALADGASTIDDVLGLLAGRAEQVA